MIREEDGSSEAVVSVSSREYAMDSELLRVLVIEDNPLDARMIEELLSRANRQPIELEHVQRLSAGLTQLASGQFDVVLVDRSTPALSPSCWPVTSTRKMRCSLPAAPTCGSRARRSSSRPAAG